MTFAELHAESLVYPHSKDHYELVKECAEIDVMNAYIEAYEFQQNNHSLMESVQAIKENTYMLESTSEDEIHAIQEGVIEKAKSVLSNLAKKVRTLLSSFLKMLSNVFDRMAKFVDPADKVAEKIDAIAADTSIPAEEKKQKINDLVEIANKEAESLGVNFVLVGEGKRHPRYDFIMRHKVKGSTNPPTIRKSGKVVLANAKKVVGDERKINNLICAFTHSDICVRSTGEGNSILGDLDGIARVYASYFGPGRENAVMRNFPKDVNSIERALTVPMEREMQIWTIKVLEEILQDVATKTIDKDTPVGAGDGTNWSAINAAATMYMNMISYDIAMLSNISKYKTNVMTKTNNYLNNGRKSVEDGNKKPIDSTATEVG